MMSEQEPWISFQTRLYSCPFCKGFVVDHPLELSRHMLKEHKIYFKNSSKYPEKRGSVIDPKKWWLISDGDVQTLRDRLSGDLLHILESGLHTTDEIPEDWKE